MFRLLGPLPVVALLLAAATLSAAPRPGERAEGPAIVGQAKSLNDLLDMTKTLVKNVAGEELYKEFEKNALPELDVGKLPGIDPKRPFGVYGTVDAELAKCRLVLLVPVTGEKPFLDMLQQYDIPVNPGKGPGTFEFVTPPDLPFPISGRIHKDYAYIAVGGGDVLESRVIIDPKDVINDQEKAVALLVLRLDRVPAETKKNLVGLLRQHTDQLADAIPEPELKAAFTAARSLGLRWLRLLAEETKEVALRFDADTKTGDVTLDLTLDPTARSPLAEAIAKRKPTQNAFAGLAGPDTVQRLYIKAPLFADEAQEAWVKLIEASESELAKNGGPPPEGKILLEGILKSLKANAAAGEMDLAAALRGPNKDGFYNVVGAVHCKEGAQMEKAIKECVKGLPAQASGCFKFDTAKVAGLSAHEVDLTNEAGDMAKAVFGTGNKGYFAFGKDALYAAYGPDSLALLKEAIEAKSGPAAVFDSTSDPKKTMDFIKKIIPPGNPNGARGLGWLGASETTALGGLKVTVDGGDRLKVRVTMNTGMLIKMGLGFWAVEARPGMAPAAPVAVPVGK